VTRVKNSVWFVTLTMTSDVTQNSDAVKQNLNSAVAEGAGDRLDTIKTLAPKLRRSPRTIQAWMRQGKVPYLKVGKSVLFRWSDVLKKLDEYRVN